MYTCRVCKLSKKVEDFYKNKSKPNGINYECIVCTKEARKAHYKKNKQKLIHKAKVWVNENPDRHKNNELKRAYGITIEIYNELYEKQHGVCAICGKSKLENGQDLAVDHCHFSGKIRGLLCKACNRGLGMFSDNLELVSKAAEYLRNAK